MSTGPQWTDADDNELLCLVNKHGPRKWAVVARALKTKSSKQCRRRYINVLASEMKTTDWSAEEDRILIEGRREHGNKWSLLAGLIGGRTDNAVKNRWAALCKKDPQLERSNTPGELSCDRNTTITRRRRRRKRAKSEESGDDSSETGSELEASPGPSSGSAAAAASCSPPQPAELLLADLDLDDQEMLDAVEMLDAAEVDGADSDDAALLTDMNQVPPGGMRPPFRGLSITIPPDEIEDLVNEADDILMARASSGGLSIRIYQGLLTPTDWDLVSEINAASDSLLRIESVAEPASASQKAPLQWGAGSEATAGVVDDEHFDSLLGFLSTVPSAEPTPRIQRGEPLQWEHRRLLHRILSSASSTPGGGAAADQLQLLQTSRSTAADVAAHLHFRKAPSMTLDRILNTSLGSGTFLMDSGPSSDWHAAAAAAVAAADSPRADVSISPHCSEEELAMLLEALNQPADPAADPSAEPAHAPT